MKNPYTSYKNRLFGKLQEQPELRMMNQALASRSLPYNQLNNQLQSMLQQTNASAGARAAAMMRGQMQIQDERQGIYTQALDAQAQRTDQLSGQLLEVTEKEQQWQEAYDQEQAAKKTQALRVGMQVLGTGIGALAGNPLMGYQIGSLASGALGIDKKGKLTAKPEQWDTGQILNSAVAIGGEIKARADEKKFQENADKMTKMWSSPGAREMIEDMSDEDYAMLLGQTYYEIRKSGYSDTFAARVNGWENKQQMKAVQNQADRAMLTRQGELMPDAAQPADEQIAQPAAQNEVSMPTETPALKPPTRGSFTAALGNDPQNNAYLKMYDTLTNSFGGKVEDPKFIEWVKSMYNAKGTYDKFKRIYGKAGGTK